MARVIKPASDQSGEGQPRSPRAEIAYWALPMLGFALALILSWRAAQQPRSLDLRTPAVLVINAALAVAVALWYAASQGALARASAVTQCVLYGIWSAAAFRLVPPVLTLVIFFRLTRGSGSNWPAALVITCIGAAIHGGLVLLMTWAHARRVLQVEGQPLWSDDDPVLRLTVTTLVVFFTLAAVFRLIAAVQE
ncbi:MAG: hypothetical protein JSV65_08985 [Armatimonadota bacterium]|nr:MAG: hypothetical protein JSV65_08985 [Armatimonadota bacterium]